MHVACMELQPPAAFRFAPADMEVIIFLARKVLCGLPAPHDIIPELRIYEVPPWHLAANLRYTISGEFFCFARLRRSAPGHARPVRTVGGCGRWVANGKHVHIRDESGRTVGHKTFFSYRFVRGARSSVSSRWVMYEYRLEEAAFQSADMEDVRNVVLCRIEKSGRGEDEGDLLHHSTQPTDERECKLTMSSAASCTPIVTLPPPQERTRSVGLKPQSRLQKISACSEKPRKESTLDERETMSLAMPRMPITAQSISPLQKISSFSEKRRRTSAIPHSPSFYRSEDARDLGTTCMIYDNPETLIHYSPQPMDELIILLPHKLITALPPPTPEEKQSPSKPLFMSSLQKTSDSSKKQRI